MDNRLAVSTRSIRYTGTTYTGPVRLENQDAIAIDGKVCLKSGSSIQGYKSVGKGVCMAVIDGMGGYSGGADAAALAACAIARMNISELHANSDIANVASVDSNTVISKDVKWINEYLSELSRRIGFAGGAWQTPDMGAALALLVIMPNRIIVANVGDCRAYAFDGNYLAQWSQDDRISSSSSALTQALGGNTLQINAHVCHLPEEKGRFVLCSDGVWETLKREELEQICQTYDDPTRVVNAVNKACYERRASDNCSIICVDASSDSSKLGDAL